MFRVWSYLNLALTARTGIIALRAHSIDLILNAHNNKHTRDISGVANREGSAAAARASISLVSLCPYDEDDGRRVFVCHSEQLSDELRSVPEVLLNQLRSDHAKESGAGLIGDGLSEKSFAWTHTGTQT